MKKRIILTIIWLSPIMLVWCWQKTDNNQQSNKISLQKQSSKKSTINPIEKEKEVKKKLQEKYNNDFNKKTATNLEKLQKKYWKDIFKKSIWDEKKWKRFIYLQANKKIKELYWPYANIMVDYLQKSLYWWNKNTFLNLKVWDNRIKIYFDKDSKIKKIGKLVKVPNKNFTQDFFNSPTIQRYKAYRLVKDFWYNKIKKYKKEDLFKKIHNWWKNIANKWLDNNKVKKITDIKELLNTNNMFIQEAIEEVYKTKNIDEYQKKIKDILWKVKNDIQSYRFKTVEQPVKINTDDFEIFIQELVKKIKK